MADTRIQVTGLREFVRKTRDVDRNLPKALRLAFNDATQIIVRDATSGMPVRSGTARSTVKARSTQTKARVVAGGNRAPYYPWLDFGGRVGRRHAVRRPFLKDGRYLYPAYFRARDSGEFEEALEDALKTIARKAGLAVDVH